MTNDDKKLSNWFIHYVLMLCALFVTLVFFVSCLASVSVIGLYR